MSATNSLLSANLRSHGRRYISTGLAVAISTAFIQINKKQFRDNIAFAAAQGR